MKKTLLPIVGLLCAVSFTACGGDDDDNNGIVIPDAPNALVTDFEVDLSPDLLAMCDVEVSYTTLSGEQKSQKVLISDYHLFDQATTFPCATSYKITMTPRADRVILEGYNYDLEMDVDFDAEGYQLGNKYTVLDPPDDEIINLDNVPGSQLNAQLEALVAKVNARNYSYSFQLGTNGKITGSQNN